MTDTRNVSNWVVSKDTEYICIKLHQTKVKISKVETMKLHTKAVE